MKKVKKPKVLKLKNRYNGEVVFTENFDTPFSEANGIKFIRVYTESNPGRTFLVNQEAYEVV